MTVLVPNASEAERQRLPGGGASVRLGWAPEHMHLVRESKRAGLSLGEVGPTAEMASAQTASNEEESAS